MQGLSSLRNAALIATGLAMRAPAQAHTHRASAPEHLGTVHFATSCAPAVVVPFDKAVSLLHSFEFGAAIQAFNGVLATDSTCAMAQWGIALSRWTNPMAPGGRPPATLAAGRQAVPAAASLGTRASARERGYIDAVGRLYADYEHAPQGNRVVAYEAAMSDVARRFPADTEATIFHAIALVASAPPTDKSYANQRRAGATLERLWAAKPDHPGLAHYIIHAYDVPALAPRACRAAARYADIAPAAAHAVHMPSHTFTRIGMWKESIATNWRSIAAARSSGAVSEVLHASDYLMYAYLQLRNDSAAEGVLDGLPAIAGHFDPKAITGAAPGSAGVFALAAIPARWALERRVWSEAASLAPTPSAFPYAEAMTHFTRALGAAHLGNTSSARAAIDALTTIRDRLMSSGGAYWGEQVAIETLEARAVLDLAEGRRDDAIAGMGEAIRHEDATEKSAVTPGPLAPARELYGDMLMELHRPADAFPEYQRSLVKEPGRFRTLYGAMQAARATGNRTAATRYAAQLERLTGSSRFTRGRLVR